MSFLRSRGFAQEEARDALTYAFVVEILDLVKPKQLRADLGKLVMARLPAGNRMKEMA